MCLSVDSKYHPLNHNSGDRYSRVLTRNLVVWKMLEHEAGVSAMSPYRCARWYFGKLKTAVNMVNRVANGIVGRGLHAYTVEDCDHSWGELYPAVIPKGSRVFIGKYDEIVATQMIVFKNKRELEKVYGPVDWKSTEQ